MRLLLSGYYGFGNAGDEALLEGLLTALRARGHEPVVLSAQPAHTRRLHGVASLHRLRGLVPGLLGCDAVISGGGGLLQDTTSARSLRYYLGVLAAARMLGKRVVVYGQSIGPLTQRGRHRVAAALRGIPVFVRDQDSAALLGDLGVDSLLVADPALLLADPSEGADPSERVRKEGREPAASRGPVVLVPRGGHPALTAPLVKVGRHFRETGAEVEILPLQPQKDEDETQTLLAEVDGSRLALEEGHRGALQRIAGARLVISSRLHGLIFALVTRTPAVGLVYDPKVSAFLTETGGSGFEPPVTGERLIAASLSAQRPDEDVRDELLARARSGIDLLEQALTAGRRAS